MNGRQFKQIRIIVGDTQKESADNVGISQSAVSKLETGYIRRLSHKHSERLLQYSLDAVKVLLAPFGVSAISVEFKKR